MLLLAAGVYWYINHQRDIRQEALRNAMQSYEAGIGQGGEFIKSFPTQEEKDKAVVKELTEVATKYSGKQEGRIARYFLGLHYADKGNLAGGREAVEIAVAESGKDAYASQAKLSLAQIYDVDWAAGRRRETAPVPHRRSDHPGFEGTGDNRARKGCWQRRIRPKPASCSSRFARNVVRSAAPPLPRSARFLLGKFRM